MRKIAIIVCSFVLISVFILSVITFNHPLKFKDEVKAASLETGIEESLIYAVIKEESSFKVKAISGAGAMGLMQVKFSTMQYVCSLNKIDSNVIDLFCAADNIKIGSLYLKYLFAKFNGLEEVLMSYNAGETVVNGWLKSGEKLDKVIYKETKNYVKNVKNSKKTYSKIYGM